MFTLKTVWLLWNFCCFCFQTDKADILHNELYSTKTIWSEETENEAEKPLMYWHFFLSSKSTNTARVHRMMGLRTWKPKNHHDMLSCNIVNIEQLNTCSLPHPKLMRSFVASSLFEISSLNVRYCCSITKTCYYTAFFMSTCSILFGLWIEISMLSEYS